MNATSRACARLAWLSLVLAAAFALLQLVNLEHEYPSQWPLKVSLGFLVLMLCFAGASTRSAAE